MTWDAGRKTVSVLRSVKGKMEGKLSPRVGTGAVKSRIKYVLKVLGLCTLLFSKGG